MAHLHELFDFTVSAFIVHEGKVLLLHHKKLNTWLQPGGHVELDEDPVAALWREIEEETGLTQSQLRMVQTAAGRPAGDQGITQLPLPFDINVHHFDDKHQHIDLCYLLLSETAQLRLENSGAHDIGWFSEQDMKTMMKSGDLHEHTYNFAVFALARSGKPLVQ